MHKRLKCTITCDIINNKKKDKIRNYLLRHEDIQCKIRNDIKYSIFTIDNCRLMS